MPVNDKNNDLRLMLENKSTEELEELLALDFSEQEDDEPNVEYIMTVMEVIHERTENIEKDRVETEEAWREFQQSIHEEELKETQTGTTEKPILDQSFKTKNRQTPRKHTRILRFCAVIAAAVVLLCGSAYAFNWNIFQAIAEWTAEIFSFTDAGQYEIGTEINPFENMQLAVSAYSDALTVPCWAPRDTMQVGETEVEERKSKTVIQGLFATGERQFTVRIAVYDAVPEEFFGNYQKDDEKVKEYEAGGIIHYIMANIDYCGATWSNGNVEGSIQGEMSLEEIERMIDSIYEE